MKRILILFAHPRYEKSRINSALIKPLEKINYITIRDLYELYPDFNIDVDIEKKILTEHDIIIWHHPLYMYSAPAIIKQWIDMVLEVGWAHGSDGLFLKGKFAFNVITSGGSRESFQKTGFNRFTIREFLSPFEQTALLCRMIYLPPFAVQGTYRVKPDELTVHAADYAALLEGMSSGSYSPEELHQFQFLNDFITMKRESSIND
jgi:glutathione-regulated potassium-efflux system ancillary protein KefG